MKRVDLIHHLERHGVQFLREGGSHTSCVNRAAGKTSTVPRQREINDFLAQKICKDLAGCGKTLWTGQDVTGLHVWHKRRSPRRMLKRPSSKAAASEEARRMLRYVEPLSEARTPLADFFSTLLEVPKP